MAVAATSLQLSQRLLDRQAVAGTVTKHITYGKPSLRLLPRAGGPIDVRDIYHSPWSERPAQRLYTKILLINPKERTKYKNARKKRRCNVTEKGESSLKIIPIIRSCKHLV